MSKEAMKLAIKLLKSAHVSTDLVWERHDCVQALEEALAKQEQGSTTCDKPVAWIFKPNRELLWPHEIERNNSLELNEYVPLYTTPYAPEGRQQSTRVKPHEWRGLTDEEKKEIEKQSVFVEGAVRLTEAKLKEKNT